MLINILSRLSPPVLTASLAGSMIYILTQRKFNGISRLIAFFSSFFMGVAGADTTLEIIKAFIPLEINVDRPVGAFICSALVVTISVNAISYVENHMVIKNYKDK